jgi:Protein of unknown function (DUF3352)
MKRVTVRVRLVLPALLATAALAAGCGSGGSGSANDGDPASVVPASAPAYAEVTVRPEGSQAAAAPALLGRILGTSDPAGAVAGLFDDAAHEYGITFDRDVEPWLGDRVGAALTAPGKQPDAIVVAASRDDDAAQATLDKALRDGAPRSYHGVDYRYDADKKLAAGIVGHQVVLGTEAGLEAAVDAASGDALADAGALKDARAKVAADRVGLLYVDVGGAVGALAASRAGPDLAAAAQVLAGALPKTLAAAVQAEPDGLRLDGVSLGTPRALLTGRSGADALNALPGDAVLGLGVADAGRVLGGLLEQATHNGGLTIAVVQGLLGQLRERSGLDLQRDVLAWMGDAGVFVAGTSPADVRIGLVVDTRDPAGTQRTIAGLRRLLARGSARVGAVREAGVDSGFVVRRPGKAPMWVALAGRRFVVALGSRAALRDAVAPATRLGDAPALKVAAAQLQGGTQPSLYADLQGLRALHDGHRSATKAQPFGALVAGAHDEGNGVVRAGGFVTLR